MFFFKQREKNDNMSLFNYSLVAETKKEGIVDVTQAYNKIVNSIREAEEAAKMADKAANDTMEVKRTNTNNILLTGLQSSFSLGLYC